MEIFLFKSDGCIACHQVIYDLKYGDWKNYASHVKLVDVKFNEQEQCFKAYIDGKETEGRAPVDAVPAMYIVDTEQFFQGLQEIKKEVETWQKAELD
jgi:hypothetical protein